MFSIKLLQSSCQQIKDLLKDIISEEQSPLVPGRLITDNVLIAYECMHTIKKQKAKTPFFALKVDMMKAYDRVEWNYLRGVMHKLGFSQEWIATIMRCVTNMEYDVKVNGELSKYFSPSRGLRQGDPVNPYLYLLCAEGLSSLIKKKEQEVYLKGDRNGSASPPIYHLLFAYDSIFFTRGDARSVHALNEVLQEYSNGLGQHINFTKSSIFLSDRCPEQIKQRVKNMLDVHK